MYTYLYMCIRLVKFWNIQVLAVATLLKLSSTPASQSPVAKFLRFFKMGACMGFVKPDEESKELASKIQQQLEKMNELLASIDKANKSLEFRHYRNKDKYLCASRSLKAYTPQASRNNAQVSFLSREEAEQPEFWYGGVRYINF